MKHFLDEKLRRRLTERRGQLHAFDALPLDKTALVLVDLTETFLGNVPDGAAVVAPVNRLIGAAHRAPIPVAWVVPTPISAWPSSAMARALLGDAALEPNDHYASIASCLDRAASDEVFEKHGYSAFFPGNSSLPDALRADGRDTVILAGLLTDMCVAASARDAFEAGFRVVVCSDATAANEAILHHTTLRTLARGYADVRPSDNIVEMMSR